MKKSKILKIFLALILSLLMIPINSYALFSKEYEGTSVEGLMRTVDLVMIIIGVIIVIVIVAVTYAAFKKNFKDNPSNSKFCQNCGEKINENENFCKNCGNKI